MLIVHQVIEHCVACWTIWQLQHSQDGGQLAGRLGASGEIVPGEAIGHHVYRGELLLWDPQLAQKVLHRSVHASDSH